MADDTTPAAPVLPPHPDFAKPPAATSTPAPAAPVAPAAPTMVPLTVEEYQRFRGIEQQFGDFQRQQAAALELKETERIRALADKGQTEEAFKAHRQLYEAKQVEAEAKYAALETKVFEKERNAVINEVLAGEKIAGETPELRAARTGILKLQLQGLVEVSRDSSGEIVVKDKASGRPAADVLRERLSDPALAIFFEPNSRGGSGGDGTRTPANPEKPAPGSLQDVAAQWKASRGQYQPMGLNPI